MYLSIKILDEKSKAVAVQCGQDEVNLVYTSEYKEGDRIVIEAEHTPAYVWLQVDDALGGSLVYLTGDVEYTIPFHEKRGNLSPKAFYGNRHLLKVRCAYDFEIDTYRNMTLNLSDQPGISNLYPHASANVETRGETAFAAVNAIDGVTATSCHGDWPYESWGINQRADAAIRIDFGREILADRVIIYERADFPHDNYWTSATMHFSDGSKEEITLKRTGYGQEIMLSERVISWIELKDLVKSEDDSPFPALTQLEVYGREAK